MVLDWIIVKCASNNYSNSSIEIFCVISSRTCCTSAIPLAGWSDLLNCFSCSCNVCVEGGGGVSVNSFVSELLAVI